MCYAVFPNGPNNRKSWVNKRTTISHEFKRYKTFTFEVVRTDNPTK